MLHEGRDLLIARKWIMPTAVGTLALGRGPQCPPVPDTALYSGNDNENRPFSLCGLLKQQP